MIDLSQWFGIGFDCSDKCRKYARSANREISMKFVDPDQKNEGVGEKRQGNESAALAA